MTNIKAIFIDRDGTIGGRHYNTLPWFFYIIPLYKSSSAKIKAQNIKIFSFTNQPGIADGIATVADSCTRIKRFRF